MINFFSSFRAGKDVFCEKPISKTDEGTAKCYEMAKTMDRTLFCAFNRYRIVRDDQKRRTVGFK